MIFSNLVSYFHWWKRFAWVVWLLLCVLALRYRYRKLVPAWASVFTCFKHEHQRRRRQSSCVSFALVQKLSLFVFCDIISVAGLPEVLTAGAFSKIHATDVITRWFSADHVHYLNFMETCLRRRWVDCHHHHVLQCRYQILSHASDFHYHVFNNWTYRRSLKSVLWRTEPVQRLSGLEFCCFVASQRFGGWYF